MTDTHPNLVTPGPPPPLDHMGRLPLDTMPDRDILIEIAANMREAIDAIAMLENLPIVKTLAEGGNPLLAMMGRG